MDLLLPCHSRSENSGLGMSRGECRNTCNVSCSFSSKAAYLCKEEAEENTKSDSFLLSLSSCKPLYPGSQPAGETAEPRLQREQ